MLNLQKLAFGNLIRMVQICTSPARGFCYYVCALQHCCAFPAEEEVKKTAIYKLVFSLTFKKVYALYFCTDELIVVKLSMTKHL
jgi:hypothetical protein